MKYKVFSLKNNEKVLKTVVCFSHDWLFKDEKLNFKKSKVR